MQVLVLSFRLISSSAEFYHEVESYKRDVKFDLDFDIKSNLVSKVLYGDENYQPVTIIIGFQCTKLYTEDY